MRDSQLRDIPVDPSIVKFLESHHLVTLSFWNGEELWSWHSFFLYDREENILIVASSPRSKHITMLEGCQERVISGAIAQESERISSLRGLQLKGVAERAAEGKTGRHALLYLKRFPYAILKWAEVWTIKLEQLKYTDNRLGFGTKKYWPPRD